MPPLTMRDTLPALLRRVPPHTYEGFETRRKAAVFLLLTLEPPLTVLALQKSNSPDYPWRNQIALPGGHIDETDGSPLDAAFREVLEEVNLPRKEITFVTSLGHFPTIHDIDIEVMVGLWSGKGTITIDPIEASRAVRVPLHRLIALHHRKGFANRSPSVAELHYEIEDPGGDYTIWGVTARALHHLIEHLELPPAESDL